MEDKYKRLMNECVKDSRDILAHVTSLRFNCEETRFIRAVAVAILAKELFRARLQKLPYIDTTKLSDGTKPRK